MPIVVVRDDGFNYEATIVDQAERSGWRGFRFVGRARAYNRLTGGRGNDTIITNGIYGNTVFGGDGDDNIYVGNGYISGVMQTCSVKGGDGKDLIDARSAKGNCTLYGELGDDTILGSYCSDYINGGDDNDVIDAGEGNDTIHDSGWSGTINGGAGNDIINSSLWAADISSGWGDDRINLSKPGRRGNAAYIYIDDGAGDDNISIGVRADHVRAVGAAGADFFALVGNRIDFTLTYLNVSQSNVRAMDTIKGFSASDSIDLRNLTCDSGVRLRWANNYQSAGNVVLQFNLANGAEDLFVNAGARAGLLRVHFDNPGYVINRGQISF